MSFKNDNYNYEESDGQAVVEVVLTGQTAVDVVVSVMGGMFWFAHQLICIMPLIYVKQDHLLK